MTYYAYLRVTGVVGVKVEGGGGGAGTPKNSFTYR